ncbi:MAG: TIGR03619 family F420-dependent LLM class oxidoreductase [Acidimicrobiia bacterium]
MRYSVGLPVDHVRAAPEFVTGDAVGEMAAAVEAAGLDAVFVTDHPAPDDRWLAGGGHHAQDPLVALAFAAAATRRVLLHTHVFVAAYRNPFLAAKGVATLQNLSGGRVVLGVAAGYLRPEFAALGVDFDARNERLADTVAVMRRVWSEDGVAVEGPGYSARGVTQLPHPTPVPVWIGGNSTAALRRAVEIGDGWSPFPNPPAAARAVKTPAITNLDELAARLAVARAYAEEIGRTAPLTICFAPFADTSDHTVFADLGVDWLAVQFDGCTTRAEWIERVGAFASRVGRPAAAPPVPGR